MKSNPKTRRKPSKVSYGKLEARKVLTSVVLNGSQIQIAGDATDNVAIVSLSDDASEYVVSLDGNETSFNESLVSTIRFRGWNGDDRFVNQTNLVSSAFGGLGNDSLTGGTNLDFLQGEDGDDTLRGLAGNDILFGGLGNDQLFGSFGNDRLTGGGGSDEIFGGGGLDQISGGQGADTLSGGIGADEINGDGGDDYISGGAGADMLFGGTGNDTILGFAGADELFGGGGDDFLSGGNEGDLILGGLGNDYLYGGAGGDNLVGDGGNDWLYGGSQQDRLNGGTGFDRLIGGTASDTYFSDNIDFIDLQADDAITNSLIVSSTDTPINLAFNRHRPELTSFLDVYEPLTITDINVHLSITHANSEDLRAILTSPAGTSVTLFDREGTRNGIHFADTIFDDDNGRRITFALNPFGGTFQPRGFLSSFDGETSAGTWQLQIIDVWNNSDIGTLNSWSLHFNTE